MMWTTGRDDLMPKHNPSSPAAGQQPATTTDSHHHHLPSTLTPPSSASHIRNRYLEPNLSSSSSDANPVLPMSSHGEVSWETLRRQIRSLENTLESEITTYAKLCTSVSTAYSSNGKLSERTITESREVEERIEDNLKQLSLQVDQIYRLLQTSSVAPTGSMTHACNRHKEVLQEYERDFKRTRISLRECEQRASLLSSVRSEISSFKSSQIASEQDRHLNDRSSINSSHRLADDVLGQAYETRYQFSNQRRTLFNSNSRMGSVIATVPGVNSLISMINSRRRRDTLILATVAGGCTFMLLLLTFR
ncbi:hypothetical protein PGT21_021394 [Puccinia graminis f. sp. tritici]|uniref:Golgi SNAP receptor complex member 1 n=2 Tax=Puccinia graminis f. sp. tritici TaxID=56615 RepID=A0A5B0NZ05_PUCGR|nr:hypothetical protein PGT21_021394 [Puccinia graminis f. sp. tritici]